LPAQRLPLSAAISAYTLGAAFQAFEDDRWGTVVPGKRADLVWLDADPYDVDPAQLRDVAVRGTWLGGARTYARG
jgi:predicted amidohydrolase YtcJ